MVFVVVDSGVLDISGLGVTVGVKLILAVLLFVGVCVGETVSVAVLLLV